MTKIGSYWDERFLYGHHFVINHPEKTLSFLEPQKEGGCAENMRARVQDTSMSYRQHCIIASNAGFFNTTDGSCIGQSVR